MFKGEKVNMKKIKFIALAMICAFAMCGCSSKKEYNETIVTYGENKVSFKVDKSSGYSIEQGDIVSGEESPGKKNIAKDGENVAKISMARGLSMDVVVNGKEYSDVTEGKTSEGYTYKYNKNIYTDYAYFISLTDDLEVDICSKDEATVKDIFDNMIIKLVE